MYSANFASNAIALFTIHPTTGLLTYVNSYATSIPGLESISVDSTGKYLYFTRDTAQIGVMTINQSTGALTITTNATSGANNWVRLFPDPSGKFIYGVSWNGGTMKETLLFGSGCKNCPYTQPVLSPTEILNQ